MNLNTQHLNSQNSALFTRKLPRFPLFVWRLGVVNPKCIPFLTLSSAVCVFFCRHCRADLMVRHITFWTPPVPPPFFIGNPVKPLSSDIAVIIIAASHYNITMCLWVKKKQNKTTTKAVTPKHTCSLREYKLYRLQNSTSFFFSWHGAWNVFSSPFLAGLCLTFCFEDFSSCTLRLTLFKYCQFFKNNPTYTGESKKKKKDSLHSSVKAFKGIPLV